MVHVHVVFAIMKLGVIAVENVTAVKLQFEKFAGDILLPLLLLLLCFFFFFSFVKFKKKYFFSAHMWFDNNIFEADTTENQSGTPMEEVHVAIDHYFSLACPCLILVIVVHV